jgi:hypothetical protein
MTLWPDQLYSLLPAVYQIRDVERGAPLRQLLGIIGEQVQLIQDDITQLYDDWFIETCDDWVAPYLADLVGYSPVEGIAASLDVATRRGRMQQRFLYPRAQIANLVRRRRRKGVLSVLEDVARDVTGWRTRAVEFGRLVHFFQHSRFPWPQLGGTLSVRAPGIGESVNTPFDRTAHTVDTRAIRPSSGVGWFHPNKVGLFVWRRRIVPATSRNPWRLCACRSNPSLKLCSFSRLGLRRSLFVQPRPEIAEDQIAEAHNLPVILSRQLLREPGKAHASSRYYGAGDGHSVAILVKRKPDDRWRPIPNTKVLVCNLGDAPLDGVESQLKHFDAAIDPESGRFVLREEVAPLVQVQYRYPVSSNVGGGEFPRTLAPARGHTVRLSSKDMTCPDSPPNLFELIYKKLEDSRLSSARAEGVAILSPVRTCDKAALVWNLKADLCIEIADSGAFEIASDGPLVVNDDCTLEIRAANKHWPLLRLQSADGHPCGKPCMVRLGRGSRFVLDGLQICGETLRIEETECEKLTDSTAPSNSAQQGFSGEGCDQGLTLNPSTGAPLDAPRSVVVRYSTFVPGGRAPNASCGCSPNHASLALRIPGGRLSIAHSVVGTLNIEHPCCDSSPSRHDFTVACPKDPLSLRIRDSIIHAAQGRAAITGECCWPAHADLSIERSTVLGHVWVQQISSAEDSLFEGLVHTTRRAHGYMRFCYVPLDAAQLKEHCDCETSFAATRSRTSRTPPRFKCIPEASQKGRSPRSVDDCDCTPANGSVTTALAPKFVTRDFGRPGYCELAIDCPAAIRRGAQDESELGVYHDNYWPQREAALEAQLQEYTPADVTSAVIMADDLHFPMFQCCH